MVLTTDTCCNCCDPSLDGDERLVKVTVVIGRRDEPVMPGVEVKTVLAALGGEDVGEAAVVVVVLEARVGHRRRPGQRDPEPLRLGGGDQALAEAGPPVAHPGQRV